MSEKVNVPYMHKYGFTPDAEIAVINRALREFMPPIEGYEELEVTIYLHPLSPPHELDSLIAWETRSSGTYRGYPVVVAQSAKEFAVFSFGDNTSIVLLRKLLKVKV